MCAFVVFGSLFLLLASLFCFISFLFGCLSFACSACSACFACFACLVRCCFVCLLVCSQSLCAAAAVHAKHYRRVSQPRQQTHAASCTHAQSSLLGLVWLFFGNSVDAANIRKSVLFWSAACVIIEQLNACAKTCLQSARYCVSLAFACVQLATNGRHLFSVEVHVLSLVLWLASRCVGE